MLSIRISYIFIFFLFLTSCVKDMDDSPITATDSEINRFIYDAMDHYYLYENEVPQLSQEDFKQTEDYEDLINNHTPRELFYDKLVYNYRADDRFSFLMEDYTRLQNLLNGVQQQTGMEFMIGLSPEFDDNSGQVQLMGVVTYVIKDSDADSKGVQRGMLFNKIDGELLTSDNVSRLLKQDQYTVSFVSVDHDEQKILPLESIALTGTTISENPILKATVLTTQNNTRVGYLAYTGFYPSFDNKLNNAFQDFSAQGVTDLVLDLRYNGGGSVNSAVQLASMITGQFSTDQVFTKSLHNRNLSEESDRDLFFRENLTSGVSINHLNLSRVYVLTSSMTASASELIINSLDPYIEVIQIGSSTKGKYQASITVYDSPTGTPIDVSPNHTYAIQPLISKLANALGQGDYFNGLSPDHELFENPYNMGNLGQSNEPLLNKALELISGTVASQDNQEIQAIYHKSYSPISQSIYSGTFRPLFGKMNF